MGIPELISRRGALAAGYTDYELGGRGWCRVRRGHYLDAASAVGLSGTERHLVAVRAASASVSRDAVVSHVSAAVVHELPLWSVPISRVHMTRDRGGGGRTRRQLVVHRGRIRSDDQVEVDGLQVTSAARTVVDLARTLPFEQSVVIGDAALRMGKTSRYELDEQLARAARRSGCPAAKRVSGFLDGRAESVGESRSRVALRELNLPAPELQARLLAPDETQVARVDFLWPDLGVVGEFDGMIKYRTELRGPRTPEEVVIAEKIREDALRALGWIVIRWTWQDLNHSTQWLHRLHSASTITRHTPRLGSWLPTPRI
ncbi:hypothetical protein ACQP1G_40530 [Nocardia sp. CA-107356]|uniref:hypothetical protein n=1 Tax=Nocardia sp. CA-107356 TaxID=3239972 RepID=UPI003D8DE2E5